MSNKSHNDAILDDALCGALAAVFDHSGVPLERVGPSPALSITSLDAVGVIGFSGEDIRGTLVIATSVALATRTCPPSTAATLPVRDRVRDWMGELCNLTLGRVKVSLARYGQNLGLSTPVAFTGEHLRLGAVQRNRTRAWDFRCADGDVRAWIEVELDPQVRLRLADDPGVALVEGEPLLF